MVKDEEAVILNRAQAQTLNVAANAATIAQRVVDNLIGNQLAAQEGIDYVDLFGTKLAGVLEGKRHAE